MKRIELKWKESKGPTRLTARNLKQLGEQIRRIRRLKEMTQGELAESADLRQATVSDLENGTRSNAASFFKVLAALGIEMELVTIPRIATPKSKRD